MLFEYTISQRMEIIEKLSKKYQFDMHTEFAEYPDNIKDIIICGDGEGYKGLISSLDARYQRKMQGHIEMYPLEYYMTESVCTHCGGRRLNENALSFTVGGKNIAEFTEMSVDAALEFVNNLKLSQEKTIIAEAIVKELKGRLGFLKNVGLGYLTLSRSSGTLSGGESQRIRLATQIGAGLMGVLYILDAPSIGLHQRDNDKLLNALKGLRDLGNTLIVVEHDEDTMRQADYIVDIGPAAGVHGGELIAAGTPEEIMNCKDSITGQYLCGKKKIEVPQTRRNGNNLKLTVKGAKINNLRNVNVDFPLGKFICGLGIVAVGLILVGQFDGNMFVLGGIIVGQVIVPGGHVVIALGGVIAGTAQQHIPGKFPVIYEQVPADAHQDQDHHHHRYRNFQNLFHSTTPFRAISWLIIRYITNHVKYQTIL